MPLIKAQRDQILKPLQAVTGIVERRHTLPILSNVLLETHDGVLSFLATDLEIQISAKQPIENGKVENGSVTLSAKKLQDILRALPDDSEVTFDAKEPRLTVRAGKSRFNLQTLPAKDFPRLAVGTGAATQLQLPQKTLRALLAQVQFAMAVQDIRYYLNGLLFSIDGEQLRAVATDGHRLAFASTTLPTAGTKQDVILPRKSVSELIKLLEDNDEPVTIDIQATQVRFSFGGIELISKVVDGKFPDYTKVIPTNYSKHLDMDRTTLQQSLQRAAILSNEKIRGVRLVLSKDNLAIICANNEQEEAQEEIGVAYDGEPLDIGFNIAYLQDVLSYVNSDKVKLSLGDANSSALITIPTDEQFKYVVMPMRI
jgi:DNA polymerase III subunit beta